MATATYIKARTERLYVPADEDRFKPMSSPSTSKVWDILKRPSESSKPLEPKIRVPRDQHLAPDAPAEEELADLPLWDAERFLFWFEFFSQQQQTVLIADGLAAMCRDDRGLLDRLYDLLNANHLHRWQQRILIDVLAEFDNVGLSKRIHDGIKFGKDDEYRLSCVVQARRTTIPTETRSTLWRDIQDLANRLEREDPVEKPVQVRILGQALRSAAAVAEEPDLAFFVRFVDWEYDRDNTIWRDAYDSIALLLCRFVNAIGRDQVEGLTDRMCEHLDDFSRPTVRDKGDVAADACVVLRVASCRLGPELEPVADSVISQRNQRYARILMRFVQRAERRCRENWAIRPESTKADVSRVKERLSGCLG